MRNQGSPTADIWPLCGNQQEPFRGRCFVEVEKPTGTGSLCPGRWKYLPCCSRQEFSTESRFSVLRKCHWANVQAPIRTEEKTALYSDKKLTFEQRGLNKREYVKLIWKVLFKSTHAKAFSIKPFILPLAHLPEFRYRCSSQHIGDDAREGSFHTWNG